MNEAMLKKKVKSFNTWDEWHEFEESYFHISSWKESSCEQLDKDLEKEDIIVSGVRWHSFHISYDISTEIYDLHEELSYVAYEAIEGQLEEGNDFIYDKKCNFCRVWTFEKTKQLCDFCGRKLKLMS